MPGKHCYHSKTAKILHQNDFLLLLFMACVAFQECSESSSDTGGLLMRGIGN